MAKCNQLISLSFKGLICRTCQYCATSDEVAKETLQCQYEELAKSKRFTNFHTICVWR